MSTARTLELLREFHEYVDVLGGDPDIESDLHDVHSILEDSEALDATLVEFINTHDVATVDDYDAMLEHLSSHEWNGVF